MGSAGNTIHGAIRNPELRSILRADTTVTTEFAPLAADDDWFKASQVHAAGENLTLAISTWTNAFCPKHPVVPVIVTTEDTGDTFTAVSTILTGYDQFGDFISETVAHTNSSGTWTGTAVKAYDILVTASVTVTGTTTTSDATIIGYAKTYGLSKRIRASGDVVVSMFDGAADAGTLSVANQTYVVAGTPDGAKFLTLRIRGGYYMP